MKILFVNERPFNPVLGGIERVTDILTKTLIAKGNYSIYYLCGKVKEGEEYFFDYKFPAELYVLPECGLFKNKVNLDYYDNLLEKLGIEIVVNQRGLNGGFNRMLTIGTVSKISVLHSKPNSLIDHVIARILLFSKERKEQIKKTLKTILYPFFYIRAQIKTRIYLRKVYKELISLSDAVVLLSENDINEFLSNGIYHNDKIICGIPNPNTFSEYESCSLDDKEKKILYIGRFDQFEKNVLCLVRIWERIHRKHLDWKLVLVGDGPDKNRIIDYIEKKHIKNIELEGTQTDVASYYKKASFVCLTSFYEGWGMTLTEGMSFACIPFTFNNYGASYDIIDDGINGCLIPAFDEIIYAKRLEELMNDEIKRKKMAASAVEKVKMFSIEKIIPKWEMLFAKLLNDKSL